MEGEVLGKGEGGWNALVGAGGGGQGHGEAEGWELMEGMVLENGSALVGAGGGGQGHGEAEGVR